MSTQTAVICASAGRSGTSATAGVLYHLGLPMGSRVFANAPSNPKGFFVDHDLRDINFIAVPDPNNPPSFEEAELRANELRPQYEAWADKRIGEPLLFWGANCVLNAFTGRVVIDVLRGRGVKVKLVQTYRPLQHMAASLSERDGTSMADATTLQQLFLDADAQIRDYAAMLCLPFFRMDFNDLISDTREQVQDIAYFVFSGRMPHESFIDQATLFIDPSLKHHG